MAMPNRAILNVSGSEPYVIPSCLLISTEPTLPVTPTSYQNMGSSRTGDASIQAFFPPTPRSSPLKPAATSAAAVGDGFTTEEVEEALRPKPAEPWHPTEDYAECEIRELEPGPRAVSFTGRVANMFDVANTPKTLRSARGCVKLCVKDNTGAITVSFPAVSLR